MTLRKQSAELLISWPQRIAKANHMIRKLMFGQWE